VTPLDVLDASATEAIGALCRRALARPPTADELGQCLFAPEQPVIVRGDPEVGVVAAVPSEEGGWIRLLVVDPAAHGQGHGRRLLAAAEADLASGRDGPTVVTVGADPPYYLFPGVETDQLSMLCLLERCHYTREEANFNMDVDLSELPPPLDGPVPASADDRDEVDAFVTRYWANWRMEVLRALDHGTLMIERDADGISAFCAWDVNRRNLLGPVAVRHDLWGKGAGVAVLVDSLHRMREAGADRIEVSWVGPIVPYARVGGTVGRVFFVYRKRLQPQ
jgi:mycothiol synthase